MNRRLIYRNIFTYLSTIILESFGYVIDTQVQVQKQFQKSSGIVRVYNNWSCIEDF